MAIPKDIEPVAISPGRKKSVSSGVRRRQPRQIWPAESITSCPECGEEAVDRITPYSRTIGCKLDTRHFEQSFSHNSRVYFEQRDPRGGPGARAATDRYRNDLYVR